MSDVVSVGHLAIDSVFLPGTSTPFVALGGSVAYTSFAIRHLGASVSIISKVGTDFPDAYLCQFSQYGIGLSGLVKVEDAQTTRFKLKYSDDLSMRELQLESMAPPLTLEDLPKSLKAKAIHMAPIAGEITYEVAKKLRSCAQNLSFDPQGLLRIIDKAGEITLNSLPDKRILELVDTYKSSLDEIKILTNLSSPKSAIKAIHDCGVKAVIVTLGNNGALLSVDEAIYKIPVYKLHEAIDPTGAGDVFIGAFLAEYIRDKPILWCAFVGSAAASLIVESVGPTFSGDKAEIYQRAHVLYEK